MTAPLAYCFNQRFMRPFLAYYQQARHEYDGRKY